ncbi:protocadherin beta-8-like isoform X12 [Cygnus olor]|uniref:protocadherin beta-8-like isoform X12 n=1 Tax=Cygnus olor TaxID=8869 RepID=UPI001ADE3AE1|nr:protocadherin beta-8-like isoform X12 [Cygnus olor]
MGLNGDISYRFSQAISASHLPFTIDAMSGEIHVTKPLDFEVTQKFEIRVRATDGGGLSALCKVLVEVMDVNDNAPELVVSSFSNPLPENAEPGTVVALFTVRDQDSGVNGEITCALEDQLSFSLRPAYKNYYELVTVSTLDREETAQYLLVILAADSGSPPLTTTQTFTVDISDVNDNAPVFNQTSYTMYVHENNVPAVLVGAVSAVDSDAGPNAKVIYSLRPVHPAERDPCSCISVNSENGHVFVLRPLDYEQQAQPNTDWRFSQTQRPGTSGSQNGEEGGAWPNNQFDTEMLQAMILASANEAADGNSTLGGGTGTMGLSARYGPQFTLQHVPDYRQNVYIPGSTATLTNAAGKRDAKGAGSSGGNKKKSGKKEKEKK